MGNPYTAPKSDIGGSSIEGDGKRIGWRIEKVLSGQRILIAVIAAHVLAVASMIVVPSSGLSQPVVGMLVLSVLLLEVVCFFAGIIGLLKICGGLEFSGVARALLVLAMFIPVINLLALLSINGMATAFLRDSGYKVGLLGGNLRAGCRVPHRK